MPRMGPAVSCEPMKKKPAIGSTAPMALNAKTKPSVMWSAAPSSILRKPRAAVVAQIISSAATPPMSMAASPPLSSGTAVVNLGATITKITTKKASGVTTANSLEADASGWVLRSSASSSELVPRSLSWAVPLAISALSKAPAPSICALMPTGFSSQRSSSALSLGTMSLRTLKYDRNSAIMPTTQDSSSALSATATALMPPAALALMPGATPIT